MQEMVSDISHQVKTPIANLRLYGEILQERLEGENKRSHNVDGADRITGFPDSVSGQNFSSGVRYDTGSSEETASLSATGGSHQTGGRKAEKAKYQAVENGMGCRAFCPL